LIFVAHPTVGNVIHSAGENAITAFG